jgi:hypothetical protein
MRSDRGTKALLMMIALGIWTMTITQAGMPARNVEASSPPAAAREHLPEPNLPVAVEGQPVRAGTSSLPLRWRVRQAMLLDNTETDCVTVIYVGNLTSSSTKVDVEWLDTDSASVALRSVTLQPGKHQNFIPYFAVGSLTGDPFIYIDWVVVAGNFEGSAEISADDPRISVTAVLKCDESPSDPFPNSITAVPCDPLGATAEFFQAGMPAAWTPPMVEVPE